MRTAGKIIAAIFASICIVASVITFVLAFVAKTAQENPEEFKKEFSRSSSALETMSESEREAAEDAMKGVLDYFLGLEHAKVRSQGLVGAILSIVILVTVLVNLQNMPIVMPAIACGASVVGAIYCGWVIMIFMVITLFGSGLVLLSNLQKK